MSATQKSRRKTRRAPSARPGSRPRKQSPPKTPPPTLQQELLQLGRGAAQSLQQAVLALVVLALIAGAALGAWSLRPTPSYSSEGVTAGSPFDVTFRVENSSPWFALSHLKINCILAHVRASGMPPALIEANDVKFPTGNAGLEPGESATFTCPFRALIGHSIYDDPGTAQRAEIYFRAEYDAPLVGSVRITDNSTRFFLNTGLLPPRWTGKP